MVNWAGHSVRFPNVISVDVKFYTDPHINGRAAMIPTIRQAERQEDDELSKSEEDDEPTESEEDDEPEFEELPVHVYVGDYGFWDAWPLVVHEPRSHNIEEARRRFKLAVALAGIFSDHEISPRS
eukprot:tig00020782_g13706.t1